MLKILHPASFAELVILSLSKNLFCFFHSIYLLNYVHFSYKSTIKTPSKHNNLTRCQLYSKNIFHHNSQLGLLCKIIVK